MRIPVVYLASYFLSLLGNSIAAVALPLIVLQVTGSAASAGVLAAATALPALLAGVFGGVVIDRINRRTSSVVTDLISAAAIAALPLLDLLSGLNLGWFVLFGILGSIGDVPGMTARETMAAAIVRHGAMPVERLVGVREVLGAVAVITGPAAAGVLMTIFAGSTVLWITAATSAAAALLTLLIPRRVGAVAADSPTRAGNVLTQLRSGWDALRRSGFLVALTTIGGLSVFVLGALQGLVLPVYFTQIEQQGMLGFVLTALAAGSLVGGGLFALAGARLPRRAWFVAGLVGSAAGIAVIATLASPWIAFAGAFLLGIASGSLNGPIAVLTIERVPDELRGRILSTQNAILTIAAPVGIFLAGILVQFAGLAVAGIALGMVWLVAVGVGLASRSLRDLGPALPGPEASHA